MRRALVLTGGALAIAAGAVLVGSIGGYLLWRWLIAATEYDWEAS